MKYVLDTSYITSGGNDLSILTDCYVTPEVWQELTNILSAEQLSNYRHFKIQSPDYFNSCISGELFRLHLIEVDEAIKRGLKIAERGIEDKRDLREKYRAGTRKNLLDSATDLGTALLAKQLNLPLLASDGGLKTFARKMGIQVDFPKISSTLPND